MAGRPSRGLSLPLAPALPTVLPSLFPISCKVLRTCAPLTAHALSKALVPDEARSFRYGMLIFSFGSLASCPVFSLLFKKTCLSFLRPPSSGLSCAEYQSAALLCSAECGIVYRPAFPASHADAALLLPGLMHQGWLVSPSRQCSHVRAGRAPVTAHATRLPRFPILPMFPCVCGACACQGLEAWSCPVFPVPLMWPCVGGTGV